MRLEHGTFRCHGMLDYVLTPTGDLATVSGEWDLLLQHILIWAATPLGEDVDPQCGCILHKYHFRPNHGINLSKLELELRSNLQYNFPEYKISNVRVVDAYDQITNLHGIACTAMFSDFDISFFTDSEGLLEMWRSMRQTLGTLEHITNERG